jgi:F420-non-reducing hydrogenase large subunit
MKKITIDPITRLEGHGKIEIFLNDAGQVENAYLQVPELRGFEKFCEGRPAEELPRILPKICGVCPGAHHMASAKAVDEVFGVTPPPAAVKLRELYYEAHNIHSHIAHFYALAAPDFIVGPQADRSKRNILGVVEKVGLATGKAVIEARSNAQKIQKILGGHQTHVVMALPGGVSKRLKKDEAEQIKSWAAGLLDFAVTTLKIFDEYVLKNKGYVDLILSGPFKLKLNYMGLVDEKNRMNMYDGKVRVVDTEGKEILKFKPVEYLNLIAEHTEPWTYLKFPYLKEKGWKGFTDGEGTSFTHVGPTARLNACDGLATPLAQEQYERMFKTLGGKPSHYVLAQHWARVIELVYFAEHLNTLANDPEILSDKIRVIPEKITGEGTGIVEAQRGTLIHHYKTDSKGMVVSVNLIVATAFNYGPMNMGIRNAAKALVAAHGKVTDGILNMVEMAFRSFDPCFGCATHSLPGEMPLKITLRDKNGIVEVIKRD